MLFLLSFQSSEGTPLDGHNSNTSSHLVYHYVLTTLAERMQKHVFTVTLRPRSHRDALLQARAIQKPRTAENSEELL